MLMRGLVIFLLILNGATLAWQWELFAPWGWAPQTAREPERVLNQIRPEAIRVETPAATAKRLADEAALAEKSQADTAATTTATSPVPSPAAPNLAATASPAPTGTPKSSAQTAPTNPAVVKPPAAAPADNASKPTKATAP